jgi:hypothetical protein
MFLDQATGPLPPVRLLSRLYTRLPFLALVSYSGLLKALGAASNHTSHEDQGLALAAGVAGVEPEDKEALGDSPAEEPTVFRSQSKGSERRTPSSARRFGCDPYHRLGGSHCLFRGLGEEGER